MKNVILSACLIFGATVMPALANTQVNDAAFLEMVGAVEGPDGYDSVTGFAPFQPRRQLTKMTVGEVLEYQKQIRSAGAASTAVGRFQFIHNTLLELLDENDIPDSRIFDNILQDRLARVLMDRCDYYSADVRTETLANCLAGHWAALPMASGEKKGRSRYHGIAGNRSLVHLDEALDVIEARISVYSGISVEEAFREVQLSVVAIPLPARVSRP